MRNPAPCPRMSLDEEEELCRHGVEGACPPHLMADQQSIDPR